jgi:diguanylate cyclase (GGDEF)-like protein/PAS domain S-box-containing protein
VFRVLNCLTTQHDWQLVVLAGVVCFSVSIVAVNIFHRAIAAQTPSRWVWIGIAGGAIGYGIWATHFIAMLAYDPGVATSYGVALTAVSLAAAMAITSAGFALAIYDPARGAPVGGAIIGAGIVSMHYLGMWALQVPGRVTWSIDLVLVSIALGILFGFVALTVAVRIRDRRGTFAAALFLTLAIVSHHFTAMAAVTIVADPSRASDTLAMSSSVLAMGIAGVALSVLGMSSIGVMADHRLANRADKFEKIIHQLSRAQQQIEASQRLLERQKLQLDTALDHMAHGLCMFDTTERLIVCNERYANMYGLTRDQTKAGTTLRAILEARAEAGTSPTDVERYIEQRLEEVRRREPYYAENKLRDGRIFAVTHQPMPDGGWVAIHQDISAQKRAEARVVYLARHDGLTGLANRAVLREKLEEGLAHLRRRGEALAVFMLDLDHFKMVNDTLGHPVGDQLLKMVARRLSNCVRETDTLARLGGDEFAIVLATAVDPRADATVVAKRILAAIAKPYEIDGHHVEIGTSLGIALAPTHGTDVDQLIKHADLALYKSKSEGRNAYCFFDDSMGVEADSRRTLQSDLRNALANNEFELHYQPIVDIGSRGIESIEALLRWRHPQNGVMRPAAFMAVAEESGLINSIGEWVLHRACNDAIGWPSHIKVSVNLSPIQFRRANAVDIVSRVLRSSGLPPERLEVEVTESVFTQGSAENIETLRQLRELGISIVLDDFGTGNSSLSYLRMFPFNKIKIDRSFTSELADNADCASIVAAVANLGRSLQIETVAEGIETEDQLALVRAAGCTHAQGYLFARPCLAADIQFPTTQAHEQTSARQSLAVANG